MTAFFVLRCLKPRKLIWILFLFIGSADLYAADFEHPFAACHQFQGTDAINKTRQEWCKKCGSGKPNSLSQLGLCDSVSFIPGIAQKGMNTNVTLKESHDLMKALQDRVIKKLETQKSAAEKLVQCDGASSMSKFCRDNNHYFASKIQEQWIPFRQAMALGPTRTVDYNYKHHPNEDPCIVLNSTPKHFYGKETAKMEPLNPTEKCVATNKLLSRFNDAPLYQKIIRTSCLGTTDPKLGVNPYETISIDRESVRASRRLLHQKNLKKYHQTIAEIPLIVYLEGMKVSEPSGPSCDIKKLEAPKPTPSQLAKAATKLLGDINGQIKRFKDAPNSLELLDYKDEVNAVLAEQQELCPAADLAQRSYDRKNLVDKNARKNDSEREAAISVRASVVSGVTCVTAPQYCIAATVATTAVAAHKAYTHYKALKTHEEHEFQAALTTGNLDSAAEAKKETGEVINSEIGNTIKASAIGFGAGAAGGVAIKQVAKTKTFKKVAGKVSGVVDDGVEAINKILSKPTVVAVTKEFKLTRSEQEVVAKMYAKLNLATDGQVEEKIRRALLTCSN